MPSKKEEDEKTYQTVKDSFNGLLESKKVKIIVYVVVGVGLIFAAGYVFKVTSKTVLNFKELHRAIKS